MLKKISLGLIVSSFFFLISSPNPAAGMRFDKNTYQKRLAEKNLQDEWYSFRVDHFIVRTDTEPTTSLKRSVQDSIDAALTKMKTDFEFKPTATYEVSLLSAGNYRQIETMDFLTAGFYQSKKIRILLKYSDTEPEKNKHFRKVFTHELTHLAVASLDGGKTPRWLNEGLAQYEEKEPKDRTPGEGKMFVEKLKSEGKTPSPDEFFSTSYKEQIKNDTDEFYQHSYIITKYLIDQYGFQKLRTLFSEMKSGASFSAAFDYVYHISLENLALKAYQY